MPIEPQRNASHLFQSSGEGRRTLAKMRGKLASSGSLSAANPASVAHKERHPIRYMHRAVAAVAVLLLAGLNYALIAHPDRILSVLGSASAPARELAPPAAFSLDDQARYWAYALYDMPGLRMRFGGSGGAALNSVKAKDSLERLLAGELGDAVRNEITALQKSRIPPSQPIARPVRR